MFEFLIPMAHAQSIVLPPVPTTVSPLLQFLLGTVSVVLTVSLPLVVAIINRHYNLQAVQTRSNMINGSVTRSASISLRQQKEGLSEGVATANALNYVKDSYPDAIGKTDEATNEHLTESIQAEVSRMVHEAKLIPVVTNNTAFNTALPPLSAS